jgi:hypothetical protein
MFVRGLVTKEKRVSYQDVAAGARDGRRWVVDTRRAVIVRQLQHLVIQKHRERVYGLKTASLTPSIRLSSLESV